MTYEDNNSDNIEFHIQMSNNNNLSSYLLISTSGGP